MKRIKKAAIGNSSKAEKVFKQHKDALTIHDGMSIEALFLSFHPNYDNWFWQKAHETHPGKNATVASVRMKAWWPGITQDGHRFVSKRKNCQMNRPSLGKTTLKWPEADVW